jgi:hypothetical protein
MVTGVVVAPAGNCRRTPQARVTEQPWGVTGKLNEERRGMRHRRACVLEPDPLGTLGVMGKMSSGMGKGFSVATVTAWSDIL